jgi:hypothetical protein
LIYWLCIGKESSVQIISIFALSAGKGFHTVEFLLKIEISRKPKLDLFSHSLGKDTVGQTSVQTSGQTSRQTLCPKRSSLTHTDAKDTSPKDICSLLA